MESLEKRCQDLPAKARLADKTQACWLEAANHDNFDYIDQQVRDTFNQCLEATSKLHDAMRILKIRENWDRKNDSLVINNRLTKNGQAAYWRAMDVSFQFNAKKHEDCVIRSKFRSLRRSNVPNVTHAEQIPKAINKKARAMMPVREDFQDPVCDQTMMSDSEDQGDDEILEFFKRHRQDRYHWSRPVKSRCRFLLPKLKKKPVYFK